MSPDAAVEEVETAEYEAAERKSQKLFRAGIIIFAGLGVYSAAWLIFAVHWPDLIYMLIMIPVSALGVMYLFRGFTGSQNNAVLASIDIRSSMIEARIDTVRDEVTIIQRSFNALEHRQDRTDERVDSLETRQDKTQEFADALASKYEELRTEVAQIRGSEETAYLAGYNDASSQRPPDPAR